jgi:ParB/RepB/Spo0J family partition protein
MTEGERRSSEIDDVIVIPLSNIVVDADFKNTRLHDDSFRPNTVNSEGQRLSDLEKSMRQDGQKTPIVVSLGPDKKFHLRAGFRRHKCAVALKWSAIRAIVLPLEIKREDEYWFNILENTTRKSLSTYEVANAARLMRDEFKVPPADFAKKTGYSEAHVLKLLSCIDRLPDELTMQWQYGAGLSFDQWYTLSKLDPQNAIRYFRRWTGLPSQTQIERLARIKDKRRKRPPVKWLERMQKLYRGVEGASVPLKERVIYLQIIEFCMGERDKISGLYDPTRQKEYEHRHARRTRMGLDIPNPSELIAEEGSDDAIPRLKYD